MTAGLEVAADERETVRVFALDLDPQAARAFCAMDDPWPLQLALGAQALDGEHIECFPASDLKGVGLPDYLIEGYGISEADITADRETLEGARQHIVLLRSRAFRGTAQTLAPEPPLRHLGTYRQTQSAPPQNVAPLAGEPPPEMTPTAPVADAPSRGPFIALLIFAGFAILLIAILYLAKT